MWIRSWFLFFKQKTAYEMRISDWSSDVCSSDLTAAKPSDRLIPGCRARIWLPSTTSTDAGVWTGAVSMRMASTVTTGSVAMVLSCAAAQNGNTSNHTGVARPRTFLSEGYTSGLFHLHWTGRFNWRRRIGRTRAILHRRRDRQRVVEGQRAS